MKKIFSFVIMMVVSACCARGQLLLDGAWAGADIVADTEFTFSGDIAVTGKITVRAGATLTIHGAGNVIQRSAEFTDTLFAIRPGGRLVIDNAVIDGGNDWSGSGIASMPVSAGVVAVAPLIALKACGDIVLTDVTVRNAWMVDKNGGVRSQGAGISITDEKTSLTQKANLTMLRCTMSKLFCTYAGAAIFVNKTQNGSVFSITDSEFVGNTVWYDTVAAGSLNDGNQGGIFRTQGSTNADVTIIGGSFEGNVTNGKGGGIYWNSGTGKLSIDGGVLFSDNHAGTYGGGIITMTQLDLISASFTGNTAHYGGGLAYCPFVSGSDIVSYTVDKTVNGAVFANLSEASMTLGSGVMFKDNNASLGGGLFVEAGNIRFGTQYGSVDLGGTDTKAFYDRPVIMMLNIQGAVISGNSAAKGGGIYMHAVQYDGEPAEDGTRAGLEFIHGRIENNTATGSGGGIYLKSIPLTIGNIGGGTAVVSGNAAECDGGGVYIDNTIKVLKNQPLQVMLQSVEMSGNQTGAEGSGGGLYVCGVGGDAESSVHCSDIRLSDNTALMGGGMFIDGEELLLSGTSNTICRNEAVNGGGIYLSDGSVTMTGGAVSRNRASGAGGGLYVYSSADRCMDAIFSGGDIIDNSARAGGGVAISGYVSLATDRTSIFGNTAVNGGGIYMTGTSSAKPASMTFGQGLIYNNTAQADAPLTDGTAYHATESSVSGVGGGIFLDAWSSLSFDVDEVFGLYGNTAENAADDIFASGAGTKVVLPEVRDMNLTDFNIPAGELFWTEDYTENDTRYRDGLAGIATDVDDPAHNLRYDYALYRLKRGHIAKVGAQTLTDTYTCLTLGYEIFLVTVSKQGLKRGESSIFRVISAKQDPDTYIMLTLTGIDDAGSTVSRRLALPDGSWRVEEVTPWAWAYTHDAPSSVSSPTITDETVFHFTGGKKNSLPLHHESIDKAVMALPE